MKILELLNKANKAYPDEFLSNYYNEKTGKPRKGNGDTLAEFIVRELYETRSENQEDEAQIQCAVEILERAVRDIQSVIGALED